MYIAQATNGVFGLMNGVIHHRTHDIIVWFGNGMG